ncbi:hypothetical protein DXG01_015203 [Tephrocybe rancida]|nr:hypothetical protein DXG01_015203 [Tephrocybe rancida]
MSYEYGKKTPSRDIMPPNAPLTPSGVSTVVSSDIKTYSSTERRAAARAILRQGVHAHRHLNTYSPNGLHPAYVNLARDQEEITPKVDKIVDLIKECQTDAFDAVTSLDRLDGGISLLLRCPGFQLGPHARPDDLTIDVLMSPREYMEGGRELSKFLALMVQAFGSDVALPYLQRFALHCDEEGLTPRPAPGAVYSISFPLQSLLNITS